MPRKPSPALTDAEARVMAVLWQLETATVGDAVAALAPERTVRSEERRVGKEC